MPKSSSFTCPSAADQDVRGLDVAVHDQVRVRVRDGGEHVEEEAQPRLDAEAVRVAVAVDRLALDVLEHEVGLARAATRPRRARRAMCGCVRRARMLPSRRKRSSPARPTRLALRSLTAARPSKRPSLRRASQTLPMPPWPIERDERVGADRLAGERGRRRRPGSGVFEEALPVERAALLEQRLEIGGERRVLGAQRREPRARALRPSISSARSRWGSRTRQRSPAPSTDIAQARHRVSPDRAVEVDARLLPVPLHRPLRHAAHGGDLGEGEAAEELQVDDLGERGSTAASSSSASLIRAQLLRRPAAGLGLVVERRDLEAAAALLSACRLRA